MRFRRPAALVMETQAEEPVNLRHTPFPDWVPFVFLVVVVGGLAFWAAGPVDDPDTWWHLRLGEEFRGSWSLADPGALSSFSTRPWFATQWTLELLASFVEQGLGLPGITVLAGLGVVLLGIAVYVSSRQRGKVAAASLATSLSMLSASLSFGPRPQIASFILAAVVTAAWLRTVDDLKPRWWLVALSWLWACTHGMWFVGVVIGVVVVLGLLLDSRLTPSAAVRLGLVPLMSLLAAAVTPVGPKLVLAPFATSKMAEFVTEWQSPAFTEFVPALALFSIAIVAPTWARGPRHAWSEILLLALASGWVFLSYRTIALGVTIAAPLVAGSIQSWLPADRMRVPRWEPAAGIGAAVMIVLGIVVTAPSRGDAPLEELDRVSAALGDLPRGTIVYNEYTVGGWLEWRHRNVIPVVDGMTDAYEVDHVAGYAAASRLEPGWRDFIDGTEARYALLESDSRLAAALVESRQWRNLVDESGYVLLGRNVSR